MFHTYLNASQYDDTLFSLTLFFYVWYSSLYFLHSTYVLSFHLTLSISTWIYVRIYAYINIYIKYNDVTSNTENKIYLILGVGVVYYLGDNGQYLN